MSTESKLDDSYTSLSDSPCKQCYVVLDRISLPPDTGLDSITEKEDVKDSLTVGELTESYQKCTNSDSRIDSADEGFERNVPSCTSPCLVMLEKISVPPEGTSFNTSPNGRTQMSTKTSAVESSDLIESQSNIEECINMETSGTSLTPSGSKNMESKCHSETIRIKKRNFESSKHPGLTSNISRNMLNENDLEDSTSDDETENEFGVVSLLTKKKCRSIAKSNNSYTTANVSTKQTESTSQNLPILDDCAYAYMKQCKVLLERLNTPVDDKDIVLMRI